MKSPSSPKNGQSSIHIEVLLVALLVAVICAISWPSMHAPLLLDDNDQFNYVQGKIFSWKDCLRVDSYGLFRPLKNLTFYALQDASLFDQHLFTLTMYIGASLALFALFRQITGSPIWAFVGAMLWATCPTQVSTAVWLSASNLSIAMVFSCMCILMHDRTRASSERNIGLSIFTCICLFLAEVSYETAIATPALCGLIDLLRKRSIFSRPAIIRYASLAFVTLVYLAIRSYFGATHSVQQNNYGFSPGIEAWKLSLSAPWFLWKHCTMWLMPSGRIEFCSAYLWGESASFWELGSAWVWLLGVIGMAIFTWKRLQMVSIGILWFLAASFPPSNFIPIGSGPIEDYYLVFPGVGLSLILIGCARAILDWKNAAITTPHSSRPLIGWIFISAGIIWRVSCIPLFALQADLWNRPTDLYLRMELTRPVQFQLQATAAAELASQNKFAESKQLALKSHQTAPWHPTSSLVLGFISFKEGEYKKAEQYLQEAMSKTTPKSNVHDFAVLYLAETYHKQNAESQTIKEMLLPLLTNPKNTYHTNAIRILVESYMANNLSSNALKAAKKGLDLHPNNPKLRELLAKVEAAYPEMPESP